MARSVLADSLMAPRGDVRGALYELLDAKRIVDGDLSVGGVGRALPSQHGISNLRRLGSVGINEGKSSRFTGPEQVLPNPPGPNQLALRGSKLGWDRSYRRPAHHLAKLVFVTKIEKVAGGANLYAKPASRQALTVMDHQSAPVGRGVECSRDVFITTG